MKLLLTICLIITNSFLFSQVKPIKIPKKIRTSIPLLTYYLTYQLTDEESKVEAIHTWITNNIAYDYDLLQSEEYLTGVDPSVILKSKKAICNGYVELMKSMLDQINIKNETVTGYIHNMHWMPGKLVLKEEHAWIAILIDQKWYLADPTWDAGYVGRIPTHLKPYEKKEYKKNTFKWAKRETRVLARRIKKETSRKKKFDDEPEYTDKIGFVSVPAKDYFLINTDTFLLSHLPIIPMWQLRDNFISLEDFSKSEDSLKMILDQPQSNRLDFEVETNDFIALDYLEQRIICGDEGAKFNVHNPTIKALFYYNYMALISNKNLQKIARGSIYEIEPTKYRDLNAKTDTIIKYTKLYKDFEKEYYKLDKDYDKSHNASSVANDKINLKLISKIEKAIDKTSSQIDKDQESIKANLQKIADTEIKIQGNYPKAFNYSGAKDFPVHLIQNWVDSINYEVKALKELSDKMDTLRVKTKFNSIFSNVDFSNYLLQANANYLPFNSYSTSEATDEIDSLLEKTSMNTLMLFSDSIPMELLPKDLMARLKKVESFITKANVDVKMFAGDNKIANPFKVEVFLQSHLVETLKIVKQINEKTNSFNYAIEKGIKQISGEFKKGSRLMEDQEKLKLDKYTFIQDETEKGHLREVSLIKQMDSDTKKWKEKYGGKK